jgi:hypothetical protein
MINEFSFDFATVDGLPWYLSQGYGLGRKTTEDT